MHRQNGFELVFERRKGADGLILGAAVNSLACGMRDICRFRHRIVERVDQGCNVWIWRS